MIEDVRQVSFNIDDNDNDEMSTFHPTRNSLEIDNKAGNIPVAVTAQSFTSMSRMNSSFILPNNPEDLGLEVGECPAVLKVNIGITIDKI